MHKFIHIRINIKKISKALSLACSCILLCLLSLSFNVNADAANNKLSQTHALFVLSKNSASYTDVVDLIVADWAKNKKYSIVLKEEQEKLVGLLDKTNIVISLGTGAAETVFKNKIKKPHIATLITQNSFDSLAKQYFGSEAIALAAGISPIFLDQPFERKVALAKKLLPKASRVGVMLGSATKAKISIYNNSIVDRKMKPQALVIDAGKNPIRQLDPIIKQSDVFIPVADSHLINVTTAKWILQLSYRYRVPVIGYSSNFVDAGALASVYSSAKGVAKQTLDLLDTVFNKDYIHAVHPPKYCTVKFNTNVAWYLNLTIPDELAIDAGQCDL
jgi:putative ABC transport system substrate-binding protein